MSRFVALLRAINTPPRHVKMDRLRSIVEEAGFENVATFIASGNLIFDAPESDDIVERLERALSDGLGFEVPVYLRTAAEIAAVASLRPFGDGEDDLEISFLPGVPNPQDAERLVAATSGNDRLVVIGREVYWSHVGPRSESDHSEAAVVRMLGMKTTQRSARTVRRIADRHCR
jgi:uncharacterized protein (DUF1697 family)